jgi:hypothetical protein
LIRKCASVCAFRNLPFATALANCYSEIAHAILD